MKAEVHKKIFLILNYYIEKQENIMYNTTFLTDTVCCLFSHNKCFHRNPISQQGTVALHCVVLWEAELTETKI